MRKTQISLGLAALAVSAAWPGAPALAQNIHLRMMSRALAPSSPPVLSPPLAPASLAAPLVPRLAQITPVPEGVPQETKSANTPAAAPEDTPVASSLPPIPLPAQREWSFYVANRFGFDKQSAIVQAPPPVSVPVRIDIKRHIYELVLAGEYPLSDNTSLSISVPYISQTARFSTPGGLFRQTGRGIGDVSLFVERRFPRIARGTNLTASLGMQFPTGQDPFSVRPDQLPTGVGFYQPLARVTLTKLHVPLRFFGAVDYGRAFARTVNGQRVTLPASYGGEAGVTYTLGPEFTMQTSASLSKVSSPFILGPGATVGYLSQALTYNTGKRTSLRGAIDIGLTDDSTDAYVSLGLSNTF